MDASSDQRCVIAIDAGTTGVRSRAVFVDARPAVAAYREFTQHYPSPGLVEHDATEIWDVAASTLREVVAEVGVDNVAAIGITNQRETVLAWNRSTGEPYGTAIVWQDRRTAPRCDELTAAGHLPMIRERTGLVLDPYFSGTKAAWLLEHRDIPVDDDLAIGMKTSAITLGRWDVPVVLLCYLLYVIVWDAFLTPRLQHPVFYLAVTLAFGQVAWHYTLIRSRSREGCFKAFRLNHWLGFTLFAGISASYTLK